MKDYDVIIFKYLLSCGCMPQLFGFKYLTDAIKIYIKSERTVSFEKDIYFVIAEKYDKSQWSVKKAIKNAIDTAALKYDVTDENSIFYNDSYSKSGSIIPSEFIAYSAQKLKQAD